MESSDLARDWFEHLSQHDVAVLQQAAVAAGHAPEALRTDPAVLTAVLSDAATAESISAPDPAGVAHVSPFLTFALVVHRGWAELRHASHVQEWVGARRRLPVLGGDDLRTFLAASQNRLFLTELLTSYTRVASGTTWVHTARGWRRRRFSELDPVRLAGLLEAVPASEHPGVYRRLGDLALFLTGVFPDHTELRGFGPVELGRLRHAGPREASDLPDDIGAVELLEILGARWYRLATRAAPRPLTAAMQVVSAVADDFVVARRTLNYLTDRFLFAERGRWFAGPDVRG